MRAGLWFADAAGIMLARVRGRGRPDCVGANANFSSGEAMVERTGDAWAMAVKLDGVVVEYESWEYEGRRRNEDARWMA